jgi:hypothetical protein
LAAACWPGDAEREATRLCGNADPVGLILDHAAFKRFPFRPGVIASGTKTGASAFDLAGYLLL